MVLVRRKVCSKARQAAETAAFRRREAPPKQVVWLGIIWFHNRGESESILFGGRQQSELWMVDGSAARGSVIVDSRRNGVRRAPVLLALTLAAWVVAGGIGWSLFSIGSMLL